MSNKIEKDILIDYLSSKYRRVRKKHKAEIINEVMTKLGVCRKHASLLLRPKTTGRPCKGDKRGRPSKYQREDFKVALRRVWRAAKYMCGRSLKQALPEWAAAMEKVDGPFASEVRQLLLSVSASTLDRILRPYKVKKGVSFTRSGGFREEIPIQENIWDIGIPGHMESDTVAHCGGSMHGEFVWTLTMVDIATLWTECRGVYGRGSNPVVAAIENIEYELPFDIRGYDADNGGEVLNQHILRYFRDERLSRGKPVVQVTRSREYKKNDNAHVEQRNNSLARKYLGYDRLGFAQLVPLVNHYYSQIVCPLVNHFVPSFKLKEKIRIKSNTRRIYDNPQTPYQRVMASAHVPLEYKRRLKAEHEALNPICLSREEERYRGKIDAAIIALRSAQGVAVELAIPQITKFDISTFSPLSQRQMSHIITKTPKLWGT